MQYDKKMIIYPACFACLMAIVVATATMPTADTSATEVDQDLGQFYSYTVQFIFNGSQAESISWDFGDSSTASTEWNPRHVFPAVGTYYVTQTLTNSYNGGSITTSVYKVEIMGFPVITFNSNDGTSVSEIHQTGYNLTATQPEAPVKEGYTFIAWYKDVELTVPMDWSSGVTRSMILYASWMEESQTVYNTVSFDVNGGSISMSMQSVEQGLSISVPDYVGIKEDFIFIGWESNGVIFSPGDSLAVDQDIVLTAVWETEPEVVYFTVTFDVGDLALDAPGSQTVISGSHATDPEATLDGYVLVWLLDGETYDFSSPVTSNITLTLSATEVGGHDDTPDKTILTIIIGIILVIAIVLGLIVLSKVI